MSKSPEDLRKEILKEKKRRRETENQNSNPESELGLNEALAKLGANLNAGTVDPMSLGTAVIAQVKLMISALNAQQDMTNRMSSALQILMVESGIEEVVVTPAKIAQVPKRAFMIGDINGGSGSGSVDEFIVKLIPFSDLPENIRSGAEGE